MAKIDSELVEKDSFETETDRPRSVFISIPGCISAEDRKKIGIIVQKDCSFLIRDGKTIEQILKIVRQQRLKKNGGVLVSEFS